MTEQPDLKACALRLRQALEHRDFTMPHPDYDKEPVAEHFGEVTFGDLRSLLSRITDLEAERDGLQETLTDWHDRAEAAESRLALADRLAEAGRGLEFGAYPAHGSGFVCIVEGPLDEFTSALTAYEENTSSNDLTTGEDDA